MVFLAETWLDKARLVVIRDGLQFGGYHGVLKISRGGDLALFWKNDMELMLNPLLQIILMQEDVWRFTGFYGAPETHLRMELWNLLGDLH